MQTGFSAYPSSVARTSADDVFRSVNDMIVVGSVESSVASGTNGENASSCTVTGLFGSAYATRPIGYDPVKRTSVKPAASTVRVVVRPRVVVRSANPWPNCNAPGSSADSGNA